MTAPLPRTAKDLAATLGGPCTGPEVEWFRRIEARRRRLAASTAEVMLISGRRRTVGRVAQIPAPWGRRLARLVRTIKPTRCLELGTSSGFSACYQGAALVLNGRGRLVTLEGAAEVAALATKNLQALRISTVEVVAGMFADTLPRVLEQLGTIDYAYIDGHHDHDATLRYLEMISGRLAARAVVMFDDITWSDGMRRAWKEIRRHSAFASTADLGRMGLCVAAERKGAPKAA